MDFKKSKRPDITEMEAADILYEHYHLSGDLNELVSERDQNYRVSTSNSNYEYVFKIANQDESFDILDCQNKAMNHLFSFYETAFCPTVIRTKNDEEIVSIKIREHNHFIRLLTYLPGIPLAEVNKHNDQLVYMLGCFIGKTSKAFESFEHPASKRDFHWDLKNSVPVISEYYNYHNSIEQKAIIDYFLKCYNKIISPAMPDLRQSFLHNDANDYNVIIDGDNISGIIDFGDSVYSHTVNEPAVAAAYLLLGKENPLSTLSIFLRGYNEIFELTEKEMDIIIYLVAMRLCQSVTIAAYQKSLEPDNKYLSVTENQAWKLLDKLMEMGTGISAKDLKE